MNTEIRHSYSGYICGKTWMPAVKASIGINIDLRARQGRFINGDGSYAEILESVLMENGGDFQNPLFPADAVITVTYRKGTAGKYTVRIKELRIADIAPDLVDAETVESDLYDELD